MPRRGNALSRLTSWRPSLSIVLYCIVLYVLYWRVNRNKLSRLPAALACGLIRRGCSHCIGGKPRERECPGSPPTYVWQDFLEGKKTNFTSPLFPTKLRYAS